MNYGCTYRIDPTTGEKWFQHDGVQCPVPNWVWVKYITKSGRVCGPDASFDLYWYHSGEDHEIMEYSIDQDSIKEAKQLLDLVGERYKDE